MNTNNNKIPKTVHYCWFGGKEKPKIVKRCISSWKKNLPEYNIIEWNRVILILIVMHISQRLINLKSLLL